MSGKISIATYLFRRLKQQGVDAIHGVPGDFTLRAIDQLKRAGIKWVGTCNELNAGYAADGYARIKGLGALLTTYGVGELSAINAVAGSFSEHVPVVHIVGTPNKDALKSKDQMHLIHHAFPDRRNTIFADMHYNVTVAECNLKRSEDSCDLIDNTIQAALQHHRPVYIQLPSNAVDIMVPDQGLTTALQSSWADDSIHKRTEARAAKLIELLQQATFPLLLVDRSRDLDTARKELNEFVRFSGIPTITMPSGAGMIDHDIPNYLGVHSGPVGQIDTMPLIEQADLILAFGPMFSDTQTLGWKTVPSASKTVAIPSFPTRDPVNKKSSVLDRINTKSLLNLLRLRLRPTTLRIRNYPPLLLKDFPDFRKLPAPEPSPSNSPINQTSFYTRINSYLKPHDIILLGNATPILGGRDFVLPSSTNRVICSGLSFSIGHMLPAALGAAIAQQDVHSTDSDGRPSAKGRVVLFDGDGSFQVTAQELSTIIRLRLNMTIFILNNAGYAYERLIHGMNEDYNDIAPWDYLSLPAAFGGREALRAAAEAGEEYGISCACLKTWGDLDAFLEDERFDNGFEGTGRRGLKLVDVRVGRSDVPDRFKSVFEQAGEGLRGKATVREDGGEETDKNNRVKTVEERNEQGEENTIVSTNKQSPLGIKLMSTKAGIRMLEKEELEAIRSRSRKSPNAETKTPKPVVEKVRVKHKQMEPAEEETTANSDEQTPFKISFNVSGKKIQKEEWEAMNIKTAGKTKVEARKIWQEAQKSAKEKDEQDRLRGSRSVVKETGNEITGETENGIEEERHERDVEKEENDYDDEGKIIIDSHKLGRIDVPQYVDSEGGDPDKEKLEVERVIARANAEAERAEAKKRRRAQEAKEAEERRDMLKEASQNARDTEMRQYTPGGQPDKKAKKEFSKSKEKEELRYLKGKGSERRKGNES